MATTDYTVTMVSGERWTMRADFAESASPILHVDVDGDVHSTPYQVADARHNPRRAAELVAEYWGSQSGDRDEVAAVNRE